MQCLALWRTTIFDALLLENWKLYSPGPRLFPPDEANAIQFGQLRPQLTTRLRTQWDIQMIASDLEFRYADLTGDVFQVREDWTILQLLDEYRPDWRIRQYNLWNPPYWFRVLNNPSFFD